MVVAAAAAIFAAATALFSPDPHRAKPKAVLAGGPDNLDTRGIKPKSSSSGIQVKTNAHAAPKINGSKVLLTTPENGKAIGLHDVDTDEVPSYSSSSPQARTIINQLPDWSMLLAAITAIFLAAEKQWVNFDWKPRRPDMLMDAFGLGRIVHDGFVFRQNFPIRSYEIGADRTASIETLMNHLQETALNHVKCAGLLGDGFGSTPEMCRRDLIWVVTRMQIHVDRYPSWGDIVEVDTWVGPSGKNGMRRDWLVRDTRTGETVTKATSVWVMMNKKTRRLSKIPDEVRGEIGPYFVQDGPIIDEDGRKLPKLDDSTAGHIRTGLMPRWYDLDVNQHVNNVKYIGWILESAPISILESHELAGITLEYRRECGRDSVLQSLTNVSCDEGGTAGMECTHLLRLEDGAEIVRGRTEWRAKPKAGP
ncbi:Palmitoyl-acyl carrier protein thioesterase [Nymphaea thermarum]|nr:Palmitoyl-acyl carrier protein thioesterase [Nymphaea thermarum]